MNFLKHLYLIGIFLLININNIYSQSRNNTSQIEILSQSEKLRSATGWKLDVVNNWIPNDNAISDIKLNGETISTATQNF